MTPKEDKIFGAFTECPLASLEGVPTYEYMMSLNVYLNLCSSAVDCALGWVALGYLILILQPAVFNTHCGTDFCAPINMGIHPVVPKPIPMAAILSELVRTHKHEVHLFNEHHAANCAYKKIIRKFISEKYYKSLSSRIIGFVKFTSLQILTHLITECHESNPNFVLCIGKHHLRLKHLS